MHFKKLLLILLLSALRLTARPQPASSETILSSGADAWGEEALAQSNGPDYQFFADRLPPLRYVNAAFHYYPIVLSAPGGRLKGRLISNGSALNASAGIKTWREIFPSVSFFIGSNGVEFGKEFDAAHEPRLEHGYLPVVQINDVDAGSVYQEETFAASEATNQAVLFTQFCLKEGRLGKVEARIGVKEPLHQTGHLLCDQTGAAYLSFDSSWTWNQNNQSLAATLSSSSRSTLVTFCGGAEPTFAMKFPPSAYSKERKRTVATWERIISDAMRVDVPEHMVNDAWKASLINTLMLIQGDQMNYSAGNAYETMYEAESGDAVRALLLWRMNSAAKPLIPSLLDFGRNKNLRFHDAAFKLQLLAQYYWLTRDENFIRAQRSHWTNSVELLMRERDGNTHLSPREAYCGDEAQKVFSLNSNAGAWRGLRDMAAVLEQMGEQSEAEKIEQNADELQTAIFAAVEKSEQREVHPPFIPVALFGEEKSYDILTQTRRGSYWDLMIPYVMGSGIFYGTERETAMLKYLQEHGGLCMGMVRFDQHSGLFANTDALDDCYTLRYAETLLRRDEPDRALVSFYGKLAQGMTRGTFVSAEGTSLKPLDKNGRSMYLPPNCTGSAFFLSMLRSMLVQDFSEPGKEAKTLKLLFATPRAWLEDGKTIKVKNAPTAFGEASVEARSNLALGKVEVRVMIPKRNPPETSLLKLRLPKPWRIVSATSSKPLDCKNEIIDLSGLRGEDQIRVKVSKEPLASSN